MKNRIKLMAAACAATACAQAQEMPNVVYIFPDQFRGQALGFLNEEPFASHVNTVADPVSTPNLDAIARESAVLVNTVSNCPISSPHRGMLLTGTYPHVSGITLNCNSSRPCSSLRTDLTTISDVYAAAGYDCCYIGKYHADFPLPNDPQRPGCYVEERVPAWDAYTPASRRHGFGEWYSYGTFDEHRNPHYWDNNGEKHEPHRWSPEHEADKAIEFIRSHAGKGKPFFIMVGMNPPHSSYSSYNDCAPADSGMYAGFPLKDILVRQNADTSMLKASKSARYYMTQVHGVDRETGRIFDALKELGLSDNTIFVFASDHGETMCSHGIQDPKNSPYREAVNTPFIIHWPKGLKPHVADWMMSSPDIMPTLLGLSGLGDRIPESVQGQDRSVLLREPDCAESGILSNGTHVDVPHDALYLQYLDGRKDENGLVQDAFSSARGIITDRYTFTIYIDRKYKVKRTLLFDNIEDPYQMRNIPLSERSDDVKELLNLLSSRLEAIDDPWAVDGTLTTVLPQLVLN